MTSKLAGTWHTPVIDLPVDQIIIALESTNMIETHNLSKETSTPERWEYIGRENNLALWYYRSGGTRDITGWV